jgi:glucose-1-phosphate thymidylyltransferase
MKGIILAGGLGTRLYPLTHATNKHLLPIYDQPMIYYPIKTFLDAGIDEILIVTGGPHAGDFIRVLQNGKSLGIKHLEYTYQERPDGGIADALRLGEDFSDNGPVTVILGDNTTDANIAKDIKSGALVFLKKVSDPERFGVPAFSKDGKKVVKIEEKPKKPKSNYAVTGLYVYDSKVFDYIKTLKPSARGQLEISDLNNIYIKKGKLRWVELKGFWSDAGTSASLFRTGLFWARKKGEKIF